MAVDPDSARGGEVRRGVARWAVKQVFATLVLLAVMAFSAGSLDWLGGKVFLAVWITNLVVSVLVLVPVNPELLAERSQLGEGIQKGDLLLAVLMAYSFVFIVPVAGLDARFGWSGDFATGWVAVGVLIALAGIGLMLWAMVANRFFSGVVRIQRERGHVVVQSGPYRTVRHPGYLGAVLFSAASPLVLASWWAFLPAALAIGVTVVRTRLEDRHLQQNLVGTRGYTRRVRYRLFPGIW